MLNRVFVSIFKSLLVLSDKLRRIILCLLLLFLFFFFLMKRRYFYFYISADMKIYFIKTDGRYTFNKLQVSIKKVKVIHMCEDPTHGIMVCNGKKKIRRYKSADLVTPEGQALLDICRDKKWPRKRDTRGHHKGRTSNKVIL